MRILKDQNPYIQLHHRAKQFQNIWAIKLQGPVIYMAKKAKKQLRGSLSKRLGLSQLAKKGKWTWRVCKESTSLPSTFVCFSKIDLPKKVPKLRCHIGFSFSISLVHQYLSHLRLLSSLPVHTTTTRHFYDKSNLPKRKGILVAEGERSNYFWD